VIKEFRFVNWKSFADSTLYIDPLTILIGTNASGKSNLLDGLSLLSRLAWGKDISSSLAGDSISPGIRGGLEWAARKPLDHFTLSAVVAGPDERTDFEYSIEIGTSGRNELLSESLKRIRYRVNTKNDPFRVTIFSTDGVSEGMPGITARLYNEKSGTKKELSRSFSILSQLANQPLRKEIVEAVSCVVEALKGIFILDPIPANMRDYKPFSDTLNSDASNLAGVVAALPEAERKKVEASLTTYVSKLPERDIRKVYTEPIGKFRKDAMLYCEENWTKDASPSTVDARGMSDGTLRFIAILIALMTRPEKSLLIVEEIDNGLHPSRSGLLLSVLRELGQQRSIDLLVTTHNPALLDAAGPEMVPFIVMAYRDAASGASELMQLDDIKQLPKLMAGGSVGALSTNGSLLAVVAKEKA